MRQFTNTAEYRKSRRGDADILKTSKVEMTDYDFGFIGDTMAQVKQ